jgi:hypothetical protein
MDKAKKSNNASRNEYGNSLLDLIAKFLGALRKKDALPS